MKLTVTLTDAQTGHASLRALWEQVKAWLIAGHKVTLTAKTDTRSVAQNSLMWSCLSDLSKQVTWPDGRRMTDEGWKDYLTATLSGQEMFPNMDNTGFVVISKGTSTSAMTIKEMTEVIDLAHLFGDSKGVRWSRTSLGRDWPEEATE